MGVQTSLPEQGCLCKEETEIPMTPPSPYRERVVHGATLQSAVPFVTITALWLAARGVSRVPAATLSGRLQTRFRLWPSRLLP